MTQKRAFWIFLGAWAFVLFFNAFAGCWFYSDARDFDRLFRLAGAWRPVAA